MRTSRLLRTSADSVNPVAHIAHTVCTSYVLNTAIRYLIDKEVYLQYRVEGAGEDSAEESEEFPREEQRYSYRKAGELQQWKIDIYRSIE